MKHAYIVDNAAYHHDLCYSKTTIRKQGTRFAMKKMLGELSVIVNPTLRERIDKSIVGKLIRAKVNFGFGALIKIKILNLQMTLQMNSIYRSLENFREGELMLMVSMKFGLLI